MANHKIVTGSHELHEGSMRTYSIGFGLSVALTLLAFGIIMLDIASGATAIAIIITLAIVQLFVQVKFFLHLGTGMSRRWNLTVFGFMLMVVIIVVGGSIWIMQNLNYHHEKRSSEQINSDIIKEENISR